MKRKRALRILFLIDALLPAGTEKQLLFITENLPRDRFEPSLAVLLKTDYQRQLKIKTPTISFNLTEPLWLKKPLVLWQLRRYLNREHFDILQAHFVQSHLQGGLAVRLCRHRPLFVGTRRNLYYWINDQRRSFYFLRYTAKWCDRILVNSYTAFEECQRREGIPPEKIKLIQNAIEVEKFGNISSELAKVKIGLGGKFPIIGTVGNWRPVKGLIPFLKAAARVSKKIPSAHFLLVGFGPQEAELRNLTYNLGIEKRVTFIRNHSDIPSILSAIDIAVQPSLSESFSNVLLEYMAASKPIIATRVGDTEKIIEEGKEGMLISPNNSDELSAAIVNFYCNFEKATEMGRFARNKVVANWASDKILKDYCKFYEEIARDR
jgi:glycosyltransferase involved in cell wall biosynthesis